MAHKRWGKCLTAAALAAMIALTSGISAPAWAESISELESQQESLQTRSGELNAALEEAKKNTEEKEALKQEYEDKISQVQGQIDTLNNESEPWMKRLRRSRRKLKALKRKSMRIWSF